MSEAKQLPRLAIARPSAAGPAIIVMGARSKKSSMNYRIGNVVPAILPLYSPNKFQRPGDVYRPLSKSSSRHTPRPLGLIPERQEDTNQLPSRFNSALLSQPSKFKQKNDDKGDKYDATKPSTTLPTTRLKPLNGQYRAKSAMIFGENIQSSTTNPFVLYEETDPDYMDMLGRLDERTTSTLQPPQSSPEHSQPYTYSHDSSSSYQKHRHSVCLPIKSTKSRSWTSHRNRAQSLRPYSEAVDSTTEYKYQQQSGHAAQYINFVEQASLNHRHFGMDKRDGLDYIPCERCRLRGGRCSNCKTIRIGGGYIVLDGDDESMGRGYSHLNGDSSGHHLPALTEDNHEMDGLSNNRNQGNNFGQGNNSDRGKGGSTDNLDGNTNRWGQDIGSRHGNNNDMSGSKVTSSQNYSNNNLTAKRSSSGLDSGDSNMGHRSGVGLSQSGTGSDMDTTDGLGQGRGSNSRPGSSHQISSRPVSSRNRIGSGIGNRQGLDGKHRKGGTSTSMDKKHGGRRKKSGDSSSDDGDDDDDDEKRRRKKKDGNLADIDEDDSKKKKQTKDISLHGKYGGEDSEAEQGLKYMGSLHKFKSKEDNVKALKCTLKELHGIDPLDYLAKYCIIDQSKLPNYQRVYDNVDRDEDDEIDINELDFALKAVNYDLISDAELEYVNQILELSSRYKLNFHLFSVIAALSEKVVALEDMVKKLINKMDFKALETKMKKCKELFYLLDDMDSGERDGVVTVASLAVELQAGGLTEEHVEFVVDRLNRDNKGLVEFLDYLTYVPLFVEIHDSVCGNPLDFTRTK